MTELSRERQREIAALRAKCAASMERTQPTVAATIHCSADTVEWIERDGPQIFRDYSAQERRRMAQMGQALPTGAFPIMSREDALLAIAARTRSQDAAAVQAHIARRVNALRLTDDPAFSAWK